VRIWNPGTGTTLRFLTGHTGPVRALAYAPDGKTLATGGDDDTVRIWNPATSTTLHTLHTGPVRAMAYAPDGTVLATAGDRTVRLWTLD